MSCVYSTTSKRSLLEQFKIFIRTQPCYHSYTFPLRLLLSKGAATTATVPKVTTISAEHRTTPCRKTKLGACRSEIWKQAMDKFPTHTARRRPHTRARLCHLHHRHRTTACHSPARLPRTPSVHTPTTKYQRHLYLALLLPGARPDARAVVRRAVAVLRKTRIASSCCSPWRVLLSWSCF